MKKDPILGPTIRSMHTDPTTDGRVDVVFKDEAGHKINGFTLEPGSG